MDGTTTSPDAREPAQQARGETPAARSVSDDLEMSELEMTPRSEAPPPLKQDAELGQRSHETASVEPDYFSPQPVRPYSSQIPASASAPVSARPSPTARVNVSITPVNDAMLSLDNTAVNPAARRPSVHRDGSNASTASVATIRPHSVDPYHAFIPITRQGDGPHYPNQSYAALQFQHHPTSHHQSPARTQRSNRHHFSSLSSSHIITAGLQSDFYRDMMDSGSRTVGNSPSSSPGLFSPTTPPLRPGQSEYYPNPWLHHTHRQAPKETHVADAWLHHTHRQAPKETHVADVDVDPVSGRKIINQYEVMDELGRGVHGKVKLGRNMDTGLTVAIKIVDRYSKRRRLDKNTSREDKIKREIAILKKARHQNIVSLLEVIDDPKRKKVYIVLEHVELGEVRWRTEGEKEICLIEWRRYQRESQGVQNENAALEDEKIIALAHQRLARQQRRRTRPSQKRRLGQTGNDPWSLEHGGESGDDYSEGRRSRASTLSNDQKPNPHRLPELWEKNTRTESNMETAVRTITPIPHHNQDSSPSTVLEGTMYGAYDSDAARGRTPSVAESSSSHFTDEEDEVPEHFRYVPLLTLQAALEAFRDTVLGLQYLHFQKVIHRDIKPANLLQTREHRIKISDFGVSYLGRARSQADGDQSESEDLGEGIELAKTVGTPAFYAPELCRLQDEGDIYPVSDAIDIWALGVTLYCLIYGRVPFHHHNTFTLMRKIAEEDVYIPQYRLKAVVEQHSSRPNSHARFYDSMTNSQKRAPHELEYEEVDDLLRDLLKRLLTKDPRKRITIKEIKRHPWVLQGLENFDSWVEDTDPDRSSQGRRIEVSKDDMEHAVVPVTLIDRVRSGVRKTLDTVFGVGRRTGSSRRRAQSSATGPDQSPSISAHSSSSTISQEGRRPSLAMNQSIFEALSRSRESEHPLSQSVTASPEATERTRYFESNSRTGSPAHSVEGPEYPAPLSTSWRPVTLDRAHSATSSGASVRTIRPQDVSRSGRAVSPSVPSALPGTLTALEPPSSSNLSGIFGGMPRLVNNMRSREKLLRSSKSPLEHLRAHTERSADTSDDPHGGPSIALSPALAAGQVDQPDVLKDLSPSTSRSPWPSLSELQSPDPYERTSSRQSSVSSASSHLYRAYPTRAPHDSSPAQGSEYAGVPQPHQSESYNERHSSFKDGSGRRTWTEASPIRERPLSMNFPQPPSALSRCGRPQTPDEEGLQRQKGDHYLGQDNHASRDPTLVGYPTQPKGLTPSSSEDYITSLSKSNSDPSLPSDISADSSVAPEEHPEVHPPPSIGASPSVDYINRFSTHAEDPAGYDGDGDHPLESDEDDSDEEFIVMGKKKPAKPARQPSYNVESSKADSRRSYLSERRRSARSGSNGTVKKIQPPGESDAEQRHHGS